MLLLSLLVKVVCFFLYVHFRAISLSLWAFAISHCNQFLVLGHVFLNSIAIFGVIVFEEYGSLFALRN